MRLVLILILMTFGASTSVQAQQFSVNKAKLEKCVGKLEAGKKLFGRIGDSCSLPAVERECRYGGKRSKTIYGECPVALVSQMKRWIKQESASIRKLGGKKQKEATKLTQFIGDAKEVCSKSDTGRSMDSMNRDYCRAVVLTQTYGMLHFIKTRMK